MSTETEIREFFDIYQERWNSLNYQALGELWDQDDEQPFYRPMEVDGYLSDWESLKRYFDPKPGVTYFDEIRFIYSNLKIKLVAPDVAVVMSDFEWDFKLKGGEYAKPMSGNDPVITVLKKKPEGWRMCAYVEACMHPATYVRKICELAVRPDFRHSLIESGKLTVPQRDGTGPEDYWA